ncbi:Peptidyl-prolyl cis-trans isomerase PIN4 [Fulvia fulva]|uniref:Peptidyl-prolyl cis-trans isomerase n=1 Tax=Passalora fulva TaxID=5499 RepID=A0A9Q8L7B3_PASFU|nr:Peptidyl-prolyl cis-trans isomerase PIN4 [Fulvia fulva]KAK4634108.1 Peptidyl-prolyl cis-trans isomerase PIN4 [Fulvia fulva]KAK4637942.1 Peptidyl-prolyl cis-trans isomerase PIN4 [Fulvia fulva]UJO12054.1 Peptidyl-prolyl cis-trans isomerase PIN4 [Fulvia fulva]WPV08578.1 Peptidyl-prolyl cis-trans isomerase PIN4 [Fulvia fulva]WPV24542.1 Peptidyl-prolyl cis-trans isomerase PIN4 [Fulvia fulva]
MAPKGKDKAKGKDAGEDKAKKGKKDGYQQINTRHILCAKHSKKEEALAKLNEGFKFDDVAREFSEDKARAGGALGWKLKDQLLSEFWEAAITLQPSTTAKPSWTECKTTEGYHIIMLEGGK